MQGIAGFGIDAVAAAVADDDVLRLENLDTDLGLPSEAVAVRRGCHRHDGVGRGRGRALRAVRVQRGAGGAARDAGFAARLVVAPG
jgi:hypothetical protein